MGFIRNILWNKNTVALQLLLFLMPHFIKAQKTDYKKLDYKEVDTWVRNLDTSKIDNHYLLAHTIEEKFIEKTERLRAIYVWMTENVSYDCIAYHNRKKLKAEPWEVYKYKRSICAGYANLFKELCELLSIECDVISGYALNDPKQTGKEFKKDNHAWNRVKLDDGKWYLIDATWGSGYTDEKVKKYTKEFNDYFYLTPPEQFILNHYPSKKKMQMLDKSVSKTTFINFPFASFGVFENKIKAFSPIKYCIKTKTNELIHFSYQTFDEQSIDSVKILLERGKEKSGWATDIVHEKREYYFDISFPEEGVFTMYIYLNDLLSFIYVLDIKKDESRSKQTEVVNDIEKHKIATN